MAYGIGDFLVAIAGGAAISGVVGLGWWYLRRAITAPARARQAAIEAEAERTAAEVRARHSN